MRHERMNKGMISLRLAAVLTLLTVGTAQAAGEIRLWPTATVDSNDVRLIDVAQISGLDAASTEAIGRLIIVRRVDEGRAVEVSIGDVRAALDEARVNLSLVMLRGSANCRVSRPVRPAPTAAAVHADTERARRSDAPALFRDGGASAERQANAYQGESAASSNVQDDGSLEAALNAYLDDFVGDVGGRLEIRYSRANRNTLELSRPEYQFHIAARRSDGPRLGMIWLDVEIQRGDEPAHTLPVLAEVSLLRPVVVAARIVNRGQEVALRDLRMEDRSFKRVEDIGLTDINAAVGLECARPLRPNDMVKVTDLKRKALVKRNQIVSIQSRFGGVTIQSTGRSVTDGWYGDRIEVRIEGSNERVFATVTGPATVAVTENASETDSTLARGR